MQAKQRQHVKKLPDRLTLIPPEEYPPIQPAPIRAWRSRKYVVQLYDENRKFQGMLRLSVSRSQRGNDGNWRAGITWDELQAIKREAGFGEWYAVEIYPRDHDLVNVGNMRHLWLLPVPLPIGWFE